MASDSDNDAGASVTSDSGSHGPPCRIAAVAVAQQRTCVNIIPVHFHTFYTFNSISFLWVCYKCLLVLSVHIEYNSDLSGHYKMELSYENLVTSGPNSHPPPIADDESDDEDDDDVPRVSEEESSLYTVLLKYIPGCLCVQIMFDLNTRKITMPCWSRPGRPKCFQPFVGGSEMKQRESLDWTKSKELCNSVSC